MKIKKYGDEIGNYIIYPLGKPILQSNAILCILPNLTLYLSTTNVKRENHEEITY